MISLHIANTIITNRTQALSLAARLNHYAVDAHTYEGHQAIEEMQQQLVKAGLITWEDIDTAW